MTSANKDNEVLNMLCAMQAITQNIARLHHAVCLCMESELLAG